MILIFGGTTEGRTAARVIDEAGKLFYYSTKGNEQEINLQHGERITGALDTGQMEAFCREKGIRLIIDASHPFAQRLHETVIEVSGKLQIIAIRYERIYPARLKDVSWCKDYEDAIAQLEAENISKLLALTGVQSISKLKPYWTEHSCRFRILDRESSRQLAMHQGFPPDRLCYYQPQEDERLLLRQYRPQAILLKESGMSGGFTEKVNAALEENIKVFAIQRDEEIMKDFAEVVLGEYGLRFAIQKYLPEFFPLRIGISSGTCATAATVAAAKALFEPSADITEIKVQLPNKEPITVYIKEVTKKPIIEPNGSDHLFETTATVIKDAGDDPDVTNGIAIIASLSLVRNEDIGVDLRSSPEDFKLVLCGGEGVGTVTLPGLGMELGTPAINPPPRKMIEDNLKHYLMQTGLSIFDETFVVTISVPDGEEIAKRTFNPRIGVKGGISIIGTSGIVRPFSSEAFVNAIRKEMEVAKASGTTCVVINSGAKSERAIRSQYLELPAQAFVHYGNFIGETLKIAAEIDIPEITMGVMIGKAVKLAEGHLDTHSKKVVMNKEFLKEVANKAFCCQETINKIDHITLARELWTLLGGEERSRFFTLLLNLCREHCTPLFPNKLNILLIDEEGKIY